MNKYTLSEDGKTPVLEPDLMKWAKLFETPRRKVADTKIGDANISTVFLGIDHNFDGGEPLLWETMVFGGSMNEAQDRCGGNRDDALTMHRKMVSEVLAKEPASTTESNPV